jgi:hypothetical protein
VFEAHAGKRLELRLRAQFPSSIQVKIDDRALAEVKDSASHPELEAAGYYRISNTRPVQAGDPLFFWRVYVVLPQDKRSATNVVMAIHDSPSGQAAGQEAPPLWITLARASITTPKPSSVFFEGPDAKHHKTDDLNNDAAFIADNVTLAGWLAVTPTLLNPDGTESDNNVEDVHYSIWPDNDFIERNYGPGRRLQSRRPA